MARQLFDPFEYGASILEQQVNPLDPVDWADKKAKIKLWSKQQEIIRSVRDNRRTAVQSGHGIGKSLTASVAAAWWVDSHPPNETLVVSTAPSVKQVHAILWEEIRKIHHKAGLPGEVQISDNWIIGNRLVGFGRKPQDHDKDAFQGLHRKYVLVIIDEAAGISEWLWDAARNITTGEHCRTLAIGNPTDPSSYFRKVCRPGSGWNTIKISVFDSPRFTGEYMEPNALEDLTGPDYIEEAKKDLGEGSPMWKARIEGEFPDVDEFSLIPLGWIYQAQERWMQWKEAGGIIPEGSRKIIGADIARFGGDKTAFVDRWGDIILNPRTMPRADTMQTADMLAPGLNTSRGDLAVVDTNGLGSGVYDRVKQLGRYAQPLNVGNRTSLKDSSGQIEFYNLRVAAFWKLREALDPARSSKIMLPNPDYYPKGSKEADFAEQLASDLSAPHWKTVPGGKIVVEEKSDVKKRIGRSPDVGDALVLAWWASAGGVMLDYEQSAFAWDERVGSEDTSYAVDWDNKEEGLFNFDSDELLPNIPEYDWK